MPGLDGIETARRIRADRELTTLPTVLMVTGFGREEVLQSAEQLDIAAVLIKPATRSMMFSTIAKIFSEETLVSGGARRGAGTTVGRGLRIPQEALQTLAARSVLVVDDNSLNREVVTDLLLAVQMNVDTAADGREAIGKITEHRYDVVLMDVHMPGMDGLSAARQIRSQPRFAALPIIALTAQALPAEREATVAAGMNAHLTKPIDESLLYTTLMAVIQKPVGYSLRRLGTDPGRVQKLLGDFLRDTAAAPVTLIAQVEAEEWEQAAALVHFIRGAAFYMEATALCEAAGRFEVAARGADRVSARASCDQFIAQLTPLRQFLSEQLRWGHISRPPLALGDNPVPPR